MLISRLILDKLCYKYNPNTKMNHVLTLKAGQLSEPTVVYCVGGSTVRCGHADLGFEKDVSSCTQTSAEPRSGAPHVCHRLADVSVHTSPSIQHASPSLGPLLLLW